MSNEVKVFPFSSVKPPENPFEYKPPTRDAELLATFKAACESFCKVSKFNSMTANFYNVRQQKVPLIKFIRTVTGWGLAQAKWYVEEKLDQLYPPAEELKPVRSLGDILREKMDESDH